MDYLIAIPLPQPKLPSLAPPRVAPMQATLIHQHRRSVAPLPLRRRQHPHALLLQIEGKSIAYCHRLS